MNQKEFLSRYFEDSETHPFISISRTYGVNIDQTLTLMIFTINHYSNVYGQNNYTYCETKIQKTLFLGFCDGLPFRSIYYPYMYGPYSPKQKKNLNDLVEKSLLERTEQRSRYGDLFSHNYSILPNIRDEIRLIIEPLLHTTSLKKLVKVASYLNISTNTLEKIATGMMTNYLDSPRLILYLSRGFQNAVIESSRPWYKKSFTSGPIKFEEIPKEKKTPDERVVFEYLRKARLRPPQYPKLVKERKNKKFSAKFFKSTPRGSSYLYNSIYEVNKCWEEGDRFDRNELLETDIKSICRVLPDIPKKKRMIGESEFSEFYVTDDFDDHNYSNIIPMLIDEKQLRCTIEAFTRKNQDIHWRPFSRSIDDRLDMSPLVITAF